jgi:hypothetical protein
VLPAENTGHTPNVFMVIIVAPSSRVVAAAKRRIRGSRLNPNSRTRQPIF